MWLQDDVRRLGIMLALSLAVHLMVLAIKIAPQIQKRLHDSMPLEVVLVNAKTESKPEKADLLAQTNLDRGGNTAEERRMKSPLPAQNKPAQEVIVKPAAQAQQKPAKAVPLRAEEKQKQQRVAQLEQAAQEMMTQLHAKQSVESKTTPPATAPQPDNGVQETTLKTPSAADLVAKSMDVVHAETEISKDWDNYQNRPKRKFFSSRVKEYRFAAYIESWRQKVEKYGNMNYPEEAKTQKLYGQLLMTVSIRADGSLESVEINRSSGQKILDEAAQRIVKDVAPYSPFPENISKDTDIISITRTWTFTREDTLASQ